MDGIKRYVVELLRAFSSMNLDDNLDLDVMILDKVYPLAELPERCLSLNEKASEQSQIHKWLRSIHSLVPPILLHPIKWLIPAWAALRFLGMEKSDIRVPVLDLTGRKLLLLILPPVLVPERFVQFLWARVDPAPYDLIHLTLPNNHRFMARTSTPVLVTVHDLCHIACPEYQTRANSVTLKMGLDRAVAGGANFLAVSEATQVQLIDEYKLDPGCVKTVHNGCSSEHFHPVEDSAIRAQVCRKYQIPESPFLLTLSTIEPRKNLTLTIEAFKLLVDELLDSDMNLVIAGARGWKSREVMRTAKASERIYLTGYIDDADLAAVYSEARGFIYASHYEGFGLPLLEAMFCGVPVIYGNNSSMPEIVGDAGLAADSRDVRDITRQMRRLVCDDELAESLGCLALERATSFSWDRTAAQTLAAYDKGAAWRRNI